MAYVIPKSLKVVDTPSEVRVVIGTLNHGDRVEVLARTPNWTRIRFDEDREGWIEGKQLIDAPSHEAGRRLLSELAQIPVQAVGHASGEANLRLEPSRDAPQLARLEAHEKVEIFGRRLVDRPAQDEAAPSAGPARDAWYLVRADSQAGWVLGRLIELDVPGGISMYAHEVNLVAWLVLNTVDDDGRQAPQYLVADRIDTQEFDFNHIRVFTWWKQQQRYATAYVESNLNGYFPIRVSRVNDILYFRLRLVDARGRKFQKVYGLFGTITRPLGIVEGWESDAMPARPAARRRGR